MALKDWTVRYKQKDFIRWKGNKKDITIEKSGNGWIFYEQFLIEETGKRFKTKSQALRYAKSYMRKH